jgi:hypothetical protein
MLCCSTSHACIVLQATFYVEGCVYTAHDDTFMPCCTLLLSKQEQLLFTGASPELFKHIALQALLPVPPLQQLPPHLAQLWSSTNSFSMRFWPTLFSVRALSNCSLVVLDADKFGELLKEYDWVGFVIMELSVWVQGLLRHHVEAVGFDFIQLVLDANQLGELMKNVTGDFKFWLV